MSRLEPSRAVLGTSGLSHGRAHGGSPRVRRPARGSGGGSKGCPHTLLGSYKEATTKRYAQSVLKVSNRFPRFRTDGSKGFPPWPTLRTVRSKGFEQASKVPNGRFERFPTSADVTHGMKQIPARSAGGADADLNLPLWPWLTWEGEGEGSPLPLPVRPWLTWDPG